MPKNDPISNVLYIDLGKKRYWVVRREDLFEKYIGGTGVATKLLLEECSEGCDPLSPENPIIFAVGPLNGLFPLASKTVAMFKSPHTGNLGESHCGGRSATAIRLTGYGAIVIKGTSSTPVYIAIHDGKVFFRSAETLWGIRSAYTVGRILREKEKGRGIRTIMRIGRAGENLVSYACVMTETYRHFGRLGLGAVFGSKKLKAIVISGKSSLPVKDKASYMKIYDEIYKLVTTSALMKKYHDLGTPENVMILNREKGLPTQNLQKATSEYAEELSGENFAENFLGRRLACSHCPVGCIHLAALREPYEDEPYFYKTSMISYDYEPIYSLGIMLGMKKARDYLKLMDEVESLGLDAMSTGVILAWVTEAFEKGVIDTCKTKGVKPSWGDLESYTKILHFIVEQPNDFYRGLARGVEFVSRKYGGEDFALSFGRNEMPGYHTGPGAHVGYLIGARHSHLDCAGYSIDRKSENVPTPESLVKRLIEEERWRQVLSSLVICFFARNIYKPEIVTKALEAVGFYFSQEGLKTLGKEIHSLKYKFKLREGFKIEELRIPKRIFETPTPLGFMSEDYIRIALKKAEELILSSVEEISQKD